MRFGTNAAAFLAALVANASIRVATAMNSNPGSFELFDPTLGTSLGYVHLKGGDVNHVSTKKIHYIAAALCTRPIYLNSSASTSMLSTH